MPGILMERTEDNLSATGSPKTPYSHKKNSSNVTSPQSSGSDREEIRFDSELHPIDGETKAVEVLNDGNDNKSDLAMKPHSHGTKSSSSKKSKRPPLLQSEWVSSTRTSPRRTVIPEKGPEIEGKPGLLPRTMKKEKNSTPRIPKPENAASDSSEPELESPDLGPFLLKRARDLVSSGDNPSRALQYALRAAKSFEKCAGGKPSLDSVMCLHVIAAIHCNLGQYNDAIPILERSISIPVLEQGQEHALAKFSGYMQLGDTYAMLGQLESSIRCYTSGLVVQKQALGDRDVKVGETFRYLAEAHVQALQLDEAERLCQLALEIHREQGSPGSLEETADRRLLGLICDTKGNYETALEHLVLASMAMMSSGQEAEVASVDSSIGDTYLALARYDEAVFAYQKALTVFKSTKGESHPLVASVFVRLADLYNKTGKFRESKAYCENALRIYSKPLPTTSSEEIASGLTDISAIYESMDEPELALKLLQRALKIYDDAPGQQSTIAGIEAQMGVLYYITENYVESYASFENAIAKLRACGEKKSVFFGIVLNQMGLACAQLYAVDEAADFFEEARTILEEEYGTYHPETLAVYSNLAGTYDAMGRLDKAIEILEHIVGVREEKLGTASPDVYDERRRLSQLLKEAGRVRHRKTRSLEMLLDTNSHATNKDRIIAV